MSAFETSSVARHWKTDEDGKENGGLVAAQGKVERHTSELGLRGEATDQH